MNASFDRARLALLLLLAVLLGVGMWAYRGVGDSLQLAAALVWADHRPTGLGFACLDRRLRRAAAQEGFEVLPMALKGTE